MAFESMVQTMVDMGLLQLFFPWLLITALTYGALKKYASDFDESVVGAIAISVGFIGMAGIFLFAPEGLFAQFGAAIGFSIFGILGLIMVMGLVGVEFDNLNDAPLQNPVVLAGIGLVALSFIGVIATQFGLGPGTVFDTVLSIDLSEEFLMQMMVLVFIVVVIGIIAR